MIILKKSLRYYRKCYLSRNQIPKIVQFASYPSDTGQALNPFELLWFALNKKSMVPVGTTLSDKVLPRTS